jgi:hypothetical protein
LPCNSICSALNNSERIGAASAENLWPAPLRWNIAPNPSKLPTKVFLAVFIFTSQAGSWLATGSSGIVPLMASLVTMREVVGEKWLAKKRSFR